METPFRPVNIGHAIAGALRRLADAIDRAMIRAAR